MTSESESTSSSEIPSVPADESVNKQRVATDNRETERFSPAKQSPEEEITDPRIRDILNQIDGGDVLDVGCVQHDPTKQYDANWLHQHLYSYADTVLGVDIDEDGVRVLRQSGFNVTTADAETLDIDGTFDYIVAGELIEHLSNPGQFLTASKSKLTEDGTLIITTPNPWCWPRLKRPRPAVKCIVIPSIHTTTTDEHYVNSSNDTSSRRLSTSSVR
jgi:2-polyprenyl-3-methyl-5-hydroxy-6-metoxy-1,4-benzoquinol methylase